MYLININYNFMKKSLLILLFAAITGSLFAQEPTSPQKETTPQPKTTQKKEENTEFKKFLKTFKTAMNTIIEDFPNDFANVKGAKDLKIKPKTSSSTDFYSKVQIPEADRTYVSYNKRKNRHTVVAVFLETKDQKEAEQLYENIGLIIQHIGFNDFNAAKNQTSDAFLSTIYWLPLVTKTSKYSNLVISTKLITTPQIDKETVEMYNLYTVAINFSHI